MAGRTFIFFVKTEKMVMDAGTSNILVSVIIPSGRPHQVFQAISCLLRQTMPQSKYEVIVVTPEARLTVLMIGTTLRIISVDNLYPPGKMRNIGAREAAGKYLFFIDDDCLPPPHWLLSMVQAVERNKKIGAVGCRVVSLKDDFWCRCADYALFGVYQYNCGSERDIGSAAIAVRRQAFEETGGFDETLYASEDWDFNFRLENHGWKRIFTPSVEVIHQHGRGAFVAILQQAYTSGFRSGLAVQKAHLNKLSLIARLSVSMNSPWLYWLLILPYAATVCFLQIIEQKKDADPDFSFFIPVIFLAKCSYHLGVLRRLFHDRLET